VGTEQAQQATYASSGCSVGWSSDRPATLPDCFPDPHVMLLPRLASQRIVTNIGRGRAHRSTKVLFLALHTHIPSK